MVMGTRKQTTASRRSKLFFIVIVAIAGAVLGVILWVWHQKPETISATRQQSKSVKFVYDDTKVSGWWTYGNNYPDSSAADSNTPKDVQWPIADISIHQCNIATKCTNPEKDTVGAHCFVSTFYMDGAINPDKAIADMIGQNKKWGTTVTEIANKTLTMTTPDGNKPYILHEFDYDTNGGETIKRGNAQGYISLNKGYIDIRAVCDEANQLDEALPALNAIRLSKV